MPSRCKIVACRSWTCIPLATTELGTDSWITELMTPEMATIGIDAGWILVYTSFIMMILRFFAGPIVHKFSPLGLLAVSSIIAAIGLVFLSKATGLTIIAAATLYGLGKTFFWPTMLGVVLQNADIAHGSYNGYTSVIQNADRQIGVLWDSIQADPELRDSTSIMVLPEFGRDSNLNQRNGLDHGDNGPDLRKVAMIAAGPDFKQGKTISKDFKSIDITPTACALMGVKSEHAKGRVLKELLAR